MTYNCNKQYELTAVQEAVSQDLHEVGIRDAPCDEPCVEAARPQAHRIRDLHSPFRRKSKHRVVKLPMASMAGLSMGSCSTHDQQLLRTSRKRRTMCRWSDMYLRAGHVVEGDDARRRAAPVHSRRLHPVGAAEVAPEPVRILSLFNVFDLLPRQRP